MITVAEVDPFPATAKRAGLTAEERDELTDYLAVNRNAGVVIPGTGGLRKMRWAGKGKGRRGGYRVVYFYFNEGVPLYLLAVYPKNQQVDLTPEQKTRLTGLAVELKKTATEPAIAVRRRVKR